MIRGLVLLALMPGCNSILGIDDPSRVDAGSGPSCRTGWSYRTSVVVRNQGAELHDYQVAVRFDAGRLVQEGRLLPDGRDLRFTDDGDRELPLVFEGTPASARALVWVRVPALRTGTTVLSMFFGNPEAPAASDEVFVEAIDNASFELSGGWTIDPPRGPPAAISFPCRDWATDGDSSLYIDEEVTGVHALAESSIHQDVSFPTGGAFRIRFDLEVIAASNGGLNGADNGRFSLRLGNGASTIWSLSGDRGIITGSYVGLETQPFGGGAVPLSFVTTVAPGHQPAYAKGMIDHLRVRRYSDPEPTAAVEGAEVGCP